VGAVILAVTRSVDETRALAAALAELARPGDIIVLAGDLGAGKTAFAQGYGAELGVRDRITSPTFTLVSQYRDGRLPLNHLDVYRLEQIEEVLDLGLTELLDEGGVTLIEWGDTITPALPADFLEVRIRLGEGDDDRVLEIQTVGPRWSARSRALSTALGPWALPDLGFPGAMDGADAPDPEDPDRSGGDPC
jgi:tRNA threonylcarbamoyladenosine biosynthesis protein TsaE